MNRLMKGILYITAGCIGIGFASLILGIVLGGGSRVWDTDFQWVKNRARDMVAVAEKKVHNYNAVESADVVEESSDGSAGLYDEVTYYEYDGDDFSGDMGIFAADASSIEDLTIDLRHGYLSIEESDDSRVQVSVSDSAGDVTASCESGRLTIQDERTGRARKDVYVYLEIPEGMQLENVNISADAGVVEADSSFSAKNLTVDVDAGQISLSDVAADAFVASVGAGTLDITDSSFQTAKLDCGLGTMEIGADIKGDAQIDCGM